MTDCPGLPHALSDDPTRMWRPWRGSDPEWVAAFEAGARVRYGLALSRTLVAGRLTYEVAVDVVGRDTPTSVRVEFPRHPDYLTYGLDPIDYPRVFADERLRSPHRMPDGSLCLYYPGDPASRRWTADKGLEELLRLTARHLFAEDYWRENEEVWPFDEAGHGFRGAA